MRRLRAPNIWSAAAGIPAVVLLTAALSVTAHASNRDILIVTSTNNSSNDVVVFKLTPGTSTLPMVDMLATGGAGGAGGNAGSVQFGAIFGAVANYGSNNVTRLLRVGNSIQVAGTIGLAPGCIHPLSVALSGNDLFVAGEKCAESHAWPLGWVEGQVVTLPDTSAGQIAVGQSWAAVTLKSGSVVQLGLTKSGDLNGTSALVTLPGGANDTPLGAAFWGDILAFDPAHSANSFALVNQNRNVFPVAGPQPQYPSNAPCWLAKGPGSVWYSGNTPGNAISIFFSDGQGGAFYKSVPLAGSPTDITVSRDGEWLAVIYAASNNTGARVAVFSIDAYGDLTPAATSGPIGIASFNGVAISE
jgi:hypothetical protein